MENNIDTTYVIFRDAIVVHFNGKTITIPKDDKRYPAIAEAIAKNELTSIPKLANNEASEEIRNLLKIRVKKGEGKQ